MVDGVELATGYVSVIPSLKDFNKELRRQIGQPIEETSEKAKEDLERGIGEGASRGAQAAKTALSILSSAAILTGLSRARDAASGLQQAVGGTVAVFGDFTDIIDEAAESSAQTFGLSQRQFREFTSQIGAGLKGYGFAVDEAAEKSIELTGLGADLSATFGGTVPEAMTAISAALRGEFDPLERYGIALRQTAIDAEAVSLGLASDTTNVDAYARAQAALSLILEQSADAQGQFLRELDSDAGRAAVATAEVEDAAASLGDALLPITAKLSEGVAFVANAFSELPGAVQTGVLALGGLVAVAGPISNAVELMRSLKPAARVAAEGLEVAQTAAQNSAAGLDNLYDSGGRGSRAMRGLAAAGTALAGVGLAVVLYDIAQSANDVAVNVEEAAQATTDELLRSALAVREVAGQGGLEDMFRQLVEGGDAGVGAALALREAFIGVGEDVSAFDEILTDVADSQARGTERTAEGTDALAEFRSETETAAPAAADFGTEVDESTVELEDFTDRLDEATQGLLDFFGAQSAGLEGEIAFRDSLRSLADLQAEVAEGNLVGQERYDELAGAVLNGRDRILDFAQGLIESGTPLDEVSARINTMSDDLFEAADRAGLTTEETAALREELGLMPEQVNTTVQTNLGDVTEDMKEWTDAIAEALQVKARLTDQQIQSVTVGDRRVRAKGGDTQTGETYLIGERGPELWTAGADGFVTPMDVFASAALPSSGGDITINVTQLPGEDQAGAALRAWRHSRRVQELVGSR